MPEQAIADTYALIDVGAALERARVKYSQEHDRGHSDVEWWVMIMTRLVMGDYVAAAQLCLHAREAHTTVEADPDAD